jgi:membrane associated rhomboid family serine protease
VIPFRTTAPGGGSAVMTLGLIAVNVAVFFIQTGLDPRSAERFVYTYALVPGLYTHPEMALRAGLDPTNFLPFVSNTFMHGGTLHLLFNMWTLWLFGVPVEGALGKWRFLLFYLAAGLAGSITHLVFNLDSFVPALGASGAIAGILGAFTVLYPKARVLLVQPIFILPIVFPLPALLYTVLWFALQAWQGLAQIGAPADSGGIAWWAHVGGFASGVVMILFLRRQGPNQTGRAPRRGPWER